MEIAAAVLLMIGVLICWALNFTGLPGNWLLICLAAAYAVFMGSESQLGIGWLAIVLLLALALAGEAIEFLAGAVGVSKSGGSKRGAALAVVGSILGGIAGMFVGAGIPIPVIGSLIAAMLFAGFGALAGAVAGEQWKGRDLDESLRIGQAAFWSRLWGTLGKALVGAVMVVLVLLALSTEML
jgi:uncharacterized protein YqgC (DUF456 family)